MARFGKLTPDDPREVAGYQLRARLGVGGMGRVYLSFTPGGRALAIKVIRAEYAEDEEFRRRFRNEVIAAQRVHGLYVAPVVDANADADQPWLATAYIPGPSLRQAVGEHGALPLPTVFRLLAGVAEGLSDVHACKIIHRDLTPANVLLAEDGPRVIDFGIAHAAAATTLTRTGVTIGTPAFMAPEQIRGRSATPATDVWALGHLGVVAATGHTAFGEGNQEALLYRIVNEPPDLDDCPKELRTIVKRCLHKNPDKRPALDEVMQYARDQNQGQTLRMATGSWLPSAVAQSLDDYSTSVLEPEPTEIVNNTKVVTGESENNSDAKAMVQGVAAVAAVVALLVIGPQKVFTTVGNFFSSTTTTTPPAALPTPHRTTTTTRPLTSVRTYTRTATATYTPPSRPAGCDQALQSITAFNSTPSGSSNEATSAHLSQLAAGMRVAAGEATDSSVRSVLRTLENDFTALSAYVKDTSGTRFATRKAQTVTDIDGLSPVCKPR